MEELLPLPKFQRYVSVAGVMLAVAVPENCTFSGGHPELGDEVKETVGAGLTVMSWLFVLVVPFAAVAVSVMVYVPGVVYVVDGFSRVDEVLLPKFQE